MTAPIAFEKRLQPLEFHSPLLGGALDAQVIELRRDPLTGHQSALNARLEDKVAMFCGATDAAVLARYVASTEPRCILCEERWRDSTPRYPAHLLPEGRLVEGEAVLFPNLFPVAQLHAVVRLGRAHDRPLAATEAAPFRDALRASIAFLRRHHQAIPEVRFATIDGNFLPPGGASLAHPHLQVVGGDAPSGWLERVQPLAEQWRAAHGQCYFAALLETERSLADRFVADTGPVGWLTSFSPDGSNEVLGVLPGRRHLLELDEPDLAGLAEGLAALLRGYGAMGLSTYNLAIYSAPLGSCDEELCCLVRVISRQNFYEHYRADDYFLQKLLRTELILTPPEKLAARLRPAFGH